MRHILLSLLFLSAPLLAAEALSNAGMDKTYIKELPPCPPGQNKTPRKDCKQQPVPTRKALTDKALRDAERQTVEPVLSNPLLNNPDALPPPTELPIPPVTPQQQEIIRQFEHLQRPPAPTPTPTP